ncbi:MAG: hypothetical protein Q7U02_09360, partial [Desulfosalsimonadaceae bacterium]|nr:hypothetical protein [Desulfosalsimonadaceae bacterium]
MRKNKKLIFSVVGGLLFIALVIFGMNLMPGEEKGNPPVNAGFKNHHPDSGQRKSTQKADSAGHPVAPSASKPKPGPVPSRIEKLKQSDDLDMTLVDGSLREYITSLYFKYRNSNDRDEFMANIKAELFAEFPAETAKKLLKIYEAYVDCELGIQEMMAGFDPPKNDEDMIFIENEI